MARWYETATGAFGWKPKTFWKATIAEFLMTVSGWKHAQGVVEPMTREEFDELEREYGAPSQSIRKASC